MSTVVNKEFEAGIMTKDEIQQLVSEVLEQKNKIIHECNERKRTDEMTYYRQFWFGLYNYVCGNCNHNFINCPMYENKITDRHHQAHRINRSKVLHETIETAPSVLINYHEKIAKHRAEIANHQMQIMILEEEINKHPERIANFQEELDNLSLYIL